MPPRRFAPAGRVTSYRFTATLPLEVVFPSVTYLLAVSEPVSGRNEPLAKRCQGWRPVADRAGVSVAGSLPRGPSGGRRAGPGGHGWRDYHAALGARGVGRGRCGAGVSLNVFLAKDNRLPPCPTLAKTHRDDDSTAICGVR